MQLTLSIPGLTWSPSQAFHPTSLSAQPIVTNVLHCWTPNGKQRGLSYSVLFHAIQVIQHLLHALKGLLFRSLGQLNPLSAASSITKFSPNKAVWEAIRSAQLPHLICTSCFFLFTPFIPPNNNATQSGHQRGTVSALPFSHPDDRIFCCQSPATKNRPHWTKNPPTQHQGQALQR